MSDADRLLDLDSEVERLSDAVYGYRRRLTFFLEAIARQWPDDRRVRIVDVGCGTGKYVTIPLARAGHEVLGVDFDAASVEHARGLSEGVAGVRFTCDDLVSIALRERFDVAVASEVLEHLHDPLALLRQLVTVLEPDGLILITIPNGWGLKEIDAQVHDRLSRLLPLGAIKGALRRVVDAVLRRGRPSLAGQTALTTLNRHDPHVQFFRVGTLRCLLEAAGLEIVAWENKMFMAGPTLNPFLVRLAPLRRVNAALIGRLPLWAGSGWMVAARRMRATA